MSSPLYICEWWCYDEVGYAVHRLAASDPAECLRRAVRHSGASDPFAFAVTAKAGEAGDAFDEMARQHAGRIVSRPLGVTGGESWRVRIAGDPIDHRLSAGAMGRFYWTWEETHHG